MNCTCIKDLEKKVTDHLADKVKNIERVWCANVAFSLGDSLEMILGIPFNVKADHPGYRSQKGKPIPITASYCPFCGIATKTEAS